ncbi:MAG: hypothetical protein K9M49_02135 [Candidatus Marinimicrobia bacterium]|nr:hypothetical protein [Candidatus Neomarinimicrobiota bacterium]MCF7903930.1 hypothetical protein [Candidatus Neomarinimicrobiota bacterium]
MNFFKQSILITIQGLIFPVLVTMISAVGEGKSGEENSFIKSFASNVLNFITNHWLLLVIIFFLSLVALLIRLRIRSIRRFRDNSIIPIAISRGGRYIKAGYFEHSSVLWLVTYPTPWDPTDLKNPNPDEYEIDLIPFCPHCEVELEEEKRFLSGYKWSCINCSFKKISDFDRSIMSDRVEKIFRSLARKNKAKVRKI